MARPKNQLRTVSLTLSTTPHVEKMLERLVDTGLFGKTPNEAAERIITEGLRQLLSDPTIKDLAPTRRKISREG